MKPSLSSTHDNISKWDLLLLLRKFNVCCDALSPSTVQITVLQLVGRWNNTCNLLPSAGQRWSRLPKTIMRRISQYSKFNFSCTKKLNFQPILSQGEKSRRARNNESSNYNLQFCGKMTKDSITYHFKCFRGNSNHMSYLTILLKLSFTQITVTNTMTRH